MLGSFYAFLFCFCFLPQAFVLGSFYAFFATGFCVRFFYAFFTTGFCVRFFLCLFCHSQGLHRMEEGGGGGGGGCWRHEAPATEKVRCLWHNYARGNCVSRWFRELSVSKGSREGRFDICHHSLSVTLAIWQYNVVVWQYNRTELNNNTESATAGSKLSVPCLLYSCAVVSVWSQDFVRSLWHNGRVILVTCFSHFAYDCLNWPTVLIPTTRNLAVTRGLSIPAYRHCCAAVSCAAYCIETAFLQCPMTVQTRCVACDPISQKPSDDRFCENAFSSRLCKCTNCGGFGDQTWRPTTSIWRIIRTRRTSSDSWTFDTNGTGRRTRFHRSAISDFQSVMTQLTFSTNVSVCVKHRIWLVSQFIRWQCVTLTLDEIGSAAQPFRGVGRCLISVLILSLNFIDNIALTVFRGEPLVSAFRNNTGTL